MTSNDLTMAPCHHSLLETPDLRVKAVLMVTEVEEVTDGKRNRGGGGGGTVTVAEAVVGNSGDKQQSTCMQQSTTSDGDGPTSTTTRANDDDDDDKYDKTLLTTSASYCRPLMKVGRKAKDGGRGLEELPVVIVHLPLLPWSWSQQLTTLTSHARGGRRVQNRMINSKQTSNNQQHEMAMGGGGDGRRQTRTMTAVVIAAAMAMERMR